MDPNNIIFIFYFNQKYNSQIDISSSLNFEILYFGGFPSCFQTLFAYLRIN